MCIHTEIRLYWLLTIGISLWLCGSMIRNVSIKWMDYPVRFSLTEKPVEIKAIPFPMVTICPETKAQKYKNIYEHGKEFGDYGMYKNINFFQ